jgi:TonB family protein
VRSTLESMPVSHRNHRVLRCAFGIVLQAAAARAAGAQPGQPCAAAVSVRDSSGAPLADANVIVGEIGYRTDVTGDVRIAVPSSAPVYARVRRIGYAPARVMLFPGCGAAPMATLVTVDPVAARLSRVTVSAERRLAYSGPLASFYERRARCDGVFFTHADMLARNAQRLTDVLRTVNGLGEVGMRPQALASRSARRGPERCPPLFVIDGMAQSTIGEISADNFDPRGLAGVEVYPDASRTPPEFLALNNGSRCGTVVIWSRHSDTYAPDENVAQKPELPDSLIFGEGDVDALAQLDSARSVTPVYPKALRRKALDGEVQVELVVDSNGRPFPRSARVLNATHKAFGDAVLQGVALMNFQPARRNERAVAQRVRMTIAFRAGKP